MATITITSGDGSISLGTAQISAATETPRHDDEANRPTRQGQVGDAAEIATVDPLRARPTFRTRARPARMADGDHRGSAITGGVLHHESERDQGGRSEGLLHGIDSPVNHTRQSPNFIKIESEPKLHAE